MDETVRLESWKEISSYLKRSEKTCQRWEINLGLPIHRLDGTPSARVFAYPKELDRWLAEKLHKIGDEAKKSAPLSFLRKKWLMAAAAVAFLAGMIILGRRVFTPSPLPIPSYKPTLAIVQFENASGDDSLEPWKTALPDLLTTDLVQSRYVTVVRITDLYRALHQLKLADASRFSNEDLMRVAEKIKVDYVATGILGKAGPETTVTISLLNPKSGKAIRPLMAGYQNEHDLFTVVDDLTRKIKLSLDLSRRYVSRDIDRNVSRISTSSPQAFKLYSQGYRLAGIEKYQEGISLLQKAVGIDPQFALAYKFLYRSCQNTLREDDEKKYIHKAIDLSRRLSERERGELEVLYYRDYQQNRAKETEALERLCRSYPDDRFGSSNLLSSYLDLEEWEKALPIAVTAWQTNRTDSNLCQKLAICYANNGLYDKTEQTLNEFISGNPDHRYLPSVVGMRIRCYIRQNKLDEALGDIEKLVTQFPKKPDNYFLWKGIVHIYQDDFGAAEQEFRRVLEQDEPFTQIDALMYLKDLYLFQGEVDEAKTQLHRGLEIADKIKGDSGRAFPMRSTLHGELAYLYRLAGQFPEALNEVGEALLNYEKSSVRSFPALELFHLKALLLLDQNKMEDFDKQADEIRRQVERTQNPARMRVYYHLLGHRELKMNNLRRAVDHLWEALDLVSVPGSMLNGGDPEYFFSLAEAYTRLEPSSSESGRALSMLEKIIMPTVDRIHNGDLYAKSHLMIAKIYDGLFRYYNRSSGGATAGQLKASKARAIDHYRKFLDLWRNADAIFAADVGEARTRLSALESE